AKVEDRLIVLARQRQPEVERVRTVGCRDLRLISEAHGARSEPRRGDLVGTRERGGEQECEDDRPGHATSVDARCSRGSSATPYLRPRCAAAPTPQPPCFRRRGEPPRTTTTCARSVR